MLTVAVATVAITTVVRENDMIDDLISYQGRFGYRFAMLHRLQWAMCREEFLNAGIQPSWFPFMARLAKESGPVTQDYLSQSLAIDKGTTARAIRNLEKQGYLLREVNPENRRQNNVIGTEKNRTTVSRMLPFVSEAMDVFMQGFTEEERETLQDLTDRMINNAQRELSER